jgi:hypothetical protein
MKQFDHMGLPTDDKQPNEMYVAETKVWVTDPVAHPYRVEFLRYEPDTPVTGPVRELPHIAFRVDNLQQCIEEGGEIVLGPFHPTDTLTVVFIYKDGAVFEYMESSEAGHWFKGGQN